MSFSLGIGAGPVAAVTLVVGASPVVVAMTTPEAYADTMLAVAVGTGGLVAFAVFGSRGKGGVAAAALLGVTAVIHWPTAAVMAGVVVGVASLSLVRFRWLALSGRDLARRAAAVIGGAAALWLVLLLLVVGVAPDSYHIPRAVFAEKLRSHLPRFGFPIALPAAILGVVALARGWVGEPDEEHGSRRRLLLAVLLAWMAVLSVAMVAWFLGLTFPVHRFVLLSIPVPILGAIALLWFSQAAGERSSLPGQGVLAVGCAVVVGVGLLLLIRSPRPVMRSDRIDSAATAGLYLERMVTDGSPVIVLAEGTATSLDILRQTFRVAIPAEWIRSLQFRPRAPREGSTNQVVLAVRGYTATFDELAAAEQERVAAPGVVVLEGPVPPAPLPAVSGPRMETNALLLFLEGLAVLLVLLLTGWGWAAAAFGNALRPRELLAVAPAVGLAALMVAGVLADQLGLRLTGGVAAILVVGTAATGVLLGLRVTQQVREG